MVTTRKSINISKYIKKIDRTIINLLTLIVSGGGTLAAIIKSNPIGKFNPPPELSMSFFGPNPFVVKEAIIQNTMAWVFSSMALTGIIAQIFKEIYKKRILEQIYEAKCYWKVVVVGILLMCIIIPVFTEIGNTIARQKVIDSQKEVFQKASFIVEHDGWREDQLGIKDRLDNPQKYIDANFQQTDKNILQMEKLLEIKKSPKTREGKIKNLKKYFRNSDKKK